VIRGEIQCRNLGMAIESWSDDGKPTPAGIPGELVCVKPFPVMPISFWKDEGGRKYHASYFEQFPGVWHHGDYVAYVVVPCQEAMWGRHLLTDGWCVGLCLTWTETAVVW
jgi:hypothetical protein